MFTNSGSEFIDALVIFMVYLVQCQFIPEISWTIRPLVNASSYDSSLGGGGGNDFRWGSLGYTPGSASFCKLAVVVIIHRLYAVQSRDTLVRDTSVRDTSVRDTSSGTHLSGAHRPRCFGQQPWLRSL
jgi:hypothetical protein